MAKYETMLVTTATLDEEATAALPEAPSLRSEGRLRAGD